MPKCIALLSGGLDSMLAIRLMQEQSIEVEALTFRTIFTCCQDDAGRAAHQLNVPLTEIIQDDDYLQLVRRPKFGYGRGANPCVDCRIYMFGKAKQFMEQRGAEFIISGEVIGQRPKSQKRRDLDVIAHHSELEDRLLRPLSARRLTPTWPERHGLVDRQRLHAFWGRGRKGLIRLAKEFGFPEIPSPSTGCQLTEPRFSRKVFDLLEHETENDRWSFELLRYGRHFRWDAETKLIVGRNEADNLALAHFHETESVRKATLMVPTNFAGPTVLITGPACDAARQAAHSLMLRYGKPPKDDEALVEQRTGANIQQCVATPNPMAETPDNISLIRRDL